jgi:glycerol-3-phosphate dehydrogenase
MTDISCMPSLALLAAEPWDLLVVGGGITGAGILREAAWSGQRVLLVEQGDFASGTSGCSSKLVHGGLHYLARLQVGLVRNAVREREQMIRTRIGLVEPLDFLLPTFQDDRVPSWMIGLALGAYDLLAGRLQVHRRLCPASLDGHAPGLTHSRTGAFLYRDAKTDDARLVLRVVQEGCRLGGVACNYTAVVELLRDPSGRVVGGRLYDRETGQTADVRARTVVNATGPWTDCVRKQLGARPRMRLVRGSHLVFPASRLRIEHAVAASHPESGRPIYLIPWEGVTLVGATTVEHGEPPDRHLRISEDEGGYLLRGVQRLFPSLRLERSDIRSTFAGVRPLVDTRTTDPGRASREHMIWEEAGMLTVAGGKLTTFRLIAHEVVRRLGFHATERPREESNDGGHDDPAPLPADLPFPPAVALRLLARYGSAGLAAIAAGSVADHQPIPGLTSLWGELRWAARTEGVRHLEDLLLRRVRIGLTAPQGGMPLLEQIRAVVQPELGWDDPRWEHEAAAYGDTWHRAHSVPEA